MNTFIILTLKLIFVAVELLNAFLRLRKFACVSSLFRKLPHLGELLQDLFCFQALALCFQ